MVDPLVVTTLGAVALAVLRLCRAYAEARVLSARSELLRAAADLAPGTTMIGSVTKSRSTWVLLAPSADRRLEVDSDC